MNYCPSCKDKHPDSETVCPEHNIPLLPPRPDPYHLVGDDKKNLLDGKYRLDWVAGRGGMAVVYCAHQISLDRMVALKVPLENLANNKSHTGMFEREARHMGKLYHKNIVAIHDFGHVDIGDLRAVPYLVMEWVQGRSLEHYISKEDLATPPETTPLSLKETSQFLRQIASALHAAHQKNIIHRDIKPSNILLLKDDSGLDYIKMVDFGISKLITDDRTYAYNTEGLGTPHYASPEQWQPNARIDVTADIYSLGIMLYQLLTGRLPFYSSFFSEVINKHMKEPPPRISAVRFEAIVVEELLLRMMDKARGNRPKDVLKIADAFEQAITPVRLEGRVVWHPENADREEAVPRATISLRDIQADDQKSDDNGNFVFDPVINLPSFKINVDAAYFINQDYEVRSGQPNSIQLTPMTLLLSGRVFAQMAENGGDIQLRRLSNVRLRMRPLGDPPKRGELGTNTDGEGRFEIRLVGPQIAYINTPYNIHIEGFQKTSQFLVDDEMRIIVMPMVETTDVPDEDEQRHCLNCDRSYDRDKVPNFCQGCGTRLLEYA